MDIPLITTDRQLAAIKVFATYNTANNILLREHTGALNVPGLMAGLKKNGWAFTCEFITITDRYGAKCRPGIYKLSPEHQRLAQDINKQSSQ